jgi:ABC-type uncharacterized transport system ATPase subunit
MDHTPTVAIRTQGLSRSFGDIVAVNELDLELPAHGVIGFVGPNGSGKSTTIRMLLGLIKPTNGRAEVLGSPSATLSAMPTGSERSSRIRRSCRTSPGARTSRPWRFCAVCR